MRCNVRKVLNVVSTIARSTCSLECSGTCHEANGSRPYRVEISILYAISYSINRNIDTLHNIFQQTEVVFAEILLIT